MYTVTVLGTSIYANGRKEKHLRMYTVTVLGTSIYANGRKEKHLRINTNMVLTLHRSYWHL